MRELERDGIPYVLHTYEDDDDGIVGKLGVAISEQLGEPPHQDSRPWSARRRPTTMSCAASPLPTSSTSRPPRAAGEKSLTMMHVKDLLAATGYVRGGCSPVGMKKRFRTLIDETCVLWDTIFISGGKRGYMA